MERLKARKDLRKPDVRSSGFKKDGPRGGFVPLSLNDHHKLVADLRLNPGVPEKVRSYFNAVRTLYVYGWYYYPFYSFVQLHSSTLVELALATKYPTQAYKKIGLKRLLDHAIKDGALTEKGFRLVRQRNAELRAVGIDARQAPSYLDVLREFFPKIRNSFVHPSMHTILMPGNALNAMRLIQTYTEHRRIDQLAAA